MKVVFKCVVILFKHKRIEYDVTPSVIKDNLDRKIKKLHIINL